ncbi:MAG TPA: hypothetical protein VG826_03205 [Pirellulales bacterium]|nr:hypothetical protein [Pirellulales bacterium]
MATIAVAAGVTAYRADPSVETTVAMDCLTVPFFTCAVVGVVYTRDWLRAFWIGVSLALRIATIIAALSLWTIIMYYGSAMPYSFSMPGRFAAVWCAAPVNGVFAIFLHWVFSPPRGVESRGASLAGLFGGLLLLMLLVAAFFGGMRFGERRESHRRDLEEWEEEQAEIEKLNE